MAKKKRTTKKKKAVRTGRARKAAGNGASVQPPKSGLPGGYPELLDALQRRVRQAQTRAALSVNRELIQLYWEIGREIVVRQEREGWGKNVVDRLARDIQTAFPGIRGFSPSNVWRMRSFYLAWRGVSPILAQPVRELSTSRKVAQPVRDLAAETPSQAVTESGETTPPPQVAGIPWGHNVVLVEKLSDNEQRLWYAAKTLEHGWSRAVLTVQIESGLFDRQGGAVSNFAATLPAPQSDLAQQTLKDPYLFDFLTLHDEAIERDLEDGLVGHIQRFLIELGAGFAFVGRQVPLSVGDDDFYIDLLFYHLTLRCFVVIDLKMRKFTPEDAGKMNFYLSAIDSQMRHANDAPSIGLVLCKDRNRITAEYALRDIDKPIGIAEWQTRLVDSLPDSLRGRLPSIQQIEEELASIESGPQLVPASQQPQIKSPKQKRKAAQKKQTQKPASPRPQATAKFPAKRSKG
jgi:predicted nuclease of restriction endonuclease-like (RecB) superfamily